MDIDWDAIGAIGETIGAVAVVITLLYLALQIRHATREQQISAVRANRAERREFFANFRDSPYIPAIQSKFRRGEALTSEEQERLMAHNALHWGLVYSEWINKNLDLPEEYATTDAGTLGYLFASPGATRWFEDYGRFIYPERFIAHIDRALAADDSGAQPANTGRSGA